MEVILEAVLLFFRSKENINIRFRKILHQKASFHKLQKLLKNRVPNTITADLPQIFPKVSDMSTIKILIYTLDKYNLHTGNVSFPDHEKLLKEVDSD